MLVVQRMHMGKPSDGYGENVPHSPHEAALPVRDTPSVPVVPVETECCIRRGRAGKAQGRARRVGRAAEQQAGRGKGQRVGGKQESRGSKERQGRTEEAGRNAARTPERRRAVLRQWDYRAEP